MKNEELFCIGASPLVDNALPPWLRSAAGYDSLALRCH
jgi:hypothetical protein